MSLSDASPQVSKLVAVVTARWSSERLPGKVLRPLQGRPLLVRVLERLQSVEQLDEVVVATSNQASDDPIAALAEAAGVLCWRGALEDVLGRIRDAAAGREADGIVRISGDSPLIDPALIRRAIDLFLERRPDLVTNVFPRSFPKGQSVEVLSRAALDRLHREARHPEDREHVTRYAYAHPDSLAICNFSAPKPRPELQLSVDTLVDFERAAALLDACGHGPGFPSVDRLIDLADELARRP
jgi:spore coat polysaccharide biosynthesis protein SpsF